MKKTKIFLSVLLAMLLALTMAIPVFGAQSGTLTINNTKAGDTYNLYRVLDLSYSGSGTAGNYAYTINSDFKNFFNEKSITTADQAYNYIKNNDDLPALAKELAKYVKDNSIAAKASPVADGATTTVDSLEYGYYLMVPSGADNGDGDQLSVVFSLDTHAPNQTIKNKSSYPTIDKEANVNDKAVSVGDIVEFTITGEVPDLSGYTKYTYKITDTMSKSLTLDANSFALKIGGTDIGDTALEDMLDSSPTDGSTFVLDIELLNNGNAKYEAGTEIVLTYSATVNENAVTGNLDPITNKAKLTYSNDPSTDGTGEPVEGPSTEVKLYTYELAIVKYAGDPTNPNAGYIDGTSTALSGAKFVLKDSNDAGAKYLVINNDNEITWVSEETAAQKFTSDSDGKISIMGLGAGTYYLEEITAPEGYNLLTEAKKVVISQPDEGTESGLVTMNVDIPNFSGSELPSTGGIGTTIFYVLGALLVIGAGVFLVVRRRMSDSNE